MKHQQLEEGEGEGEGNTVHHLFPVRAVLEGEEEGEMHHRSWRACSLVVCLRSGRQVGVLQQVSRAWLLRG